MEKIEKIGFVILNYNTWSNTINCVNSIIDSYLHPKVIVVVDNCSQNDSFLQLDNVFKEAQYSEVKLIKTAYNGGFSYGNNKGIEVIHKNNVKYCIIVNNDVLFEKNSIALLIKSLINNKDAVVSAPVILNTSSEITNLPLKKAKTFLHFLGIKKENLQLKLEDLSDVTKVYSVSGCCLCVDVKKFLEIQGFDENIFLYNEEYVLAKKVATSPYSILYSKSARVIHDHGTTTGRKNLFIDKEQLKSNLYYWYVYEKKGLNHLVLIYIFGNTRILMKIIFHKYNNSHEFTDCLKETYTAMLLTKKGVNKDYRNEA